MGAVTDIYYVTYATLSNAIDFGDLAQSEEADNKAGASNDTRGLMAGGQSTNQITYITIATTGNSTDFGDLISNVQGLAGCADSSRAIFAGGHVVSGSSTSYVHMDYVEIGTTGNATNFGNLPSSAHANALGALSDGTYGVWGGGYNKNNISYVTIQTTGNATDFGADLGNQSGGDGTAASWACSGCAA